MGEPNGAVQGMGFSLPPVLMNYDISDIILEAPSNADQVLTLPPVEFIGKGHYMLSSYAASVYVHSPEHNMITGVFEFKRKILRHVFGLIEERLIDYLYEALKDQPQKLPAARARAYYKLRSRCILNGFPDFNEITEMEPDQDDAYFWTHFPVFIKRAKTTLLSMWSTSVQKYYEAAGQLPMWTFLRNSCGESRRLTQLTPDTVEINVGAMAQRDAFENHTLSQNVKLRVSTRDSRLQDLYYYRNVNFEIARQFTAFIKEWREKHGAGSLHPPIPAGQVGLRYPANAFKDEDTISVDALL